MSEPPQSGFERVLRKVLGWIIGIFVCLVVVPYIGMMLFGIFSRPRPFPWREMLPVFLAMSGPCLLWITLAAMYFRAPRELRRIYFSGGGTSGVLYFGGIYQFFSGYRKRFGIDAWFWLMLISIPWGVITFVSVMLFLGRPRH